MNEYRIKEVRVPLKSGEKYFFYPQMKIEVIKTTGKLWWKKDTLEHGWASFWKLGGIVRATMHPMPFSELISYGSIGAAKEAIAGWNKILNDNEITKYKNDAVNWNDDRLVTIHPLDKDLSIVK